LIMLKQGSISITSLIRINGDGVMVIMLVSGRSWASGRSWVSGRSWASCRSWVVKSKTIKLVFVASPLSMLPGGKRTKTGWLGIRITCPSVATCLSADCCFSELAH
jgi:hypothetical protein